ncbi:hypothetical protein [Amazonocrinis nigriterrae]|nr:hypothetical protein [Amazonocrinis nigriterrae]
MVAAVVDITAFHDNKNEVLLNQNMNPAIAFSLRALRGDSTTQP